MSKSATLKIQNLSAKLKELDKEIFSDVSFEVKAGEIHLIMGPNGAGKSSIAKAIAGHPSLEVEGQVFLDQEDLLKMEPDERAKAGFFMAHQAPVEIPGVRLGEFLRVAYNSVQTEESEKVDIWSFSDMFGIVASSLGLNSDFITRSLNDGFSGGEKKKCEVLQLILLKPKFAILDEIDSGLDLDALKIIFAQLQEFVKDTGAGLVLITHNPKILEYLSPTSVHLLKNGKLVESGDKELAETIISKGY